MGERILCRSRRHRRQIPLCMQRHRELILCQSVPRAKSLPIPKTANLAELCPRTPRADPKPASVIGTPNVSLKKDLIIEALMPRASFKVAHETTKSETPPSNSKRLEKDMAPETGSGHFFKDRRKEDYNITGQRSHHVEDVYRRRLGSQSTSPDYIRPPRHQKDSDSVSTSSYSSYSTTSSTVSGRSGHRYRARGSHERSTSRTGSLDKRHSRHHHRRTHGSERSAGHRRHVRVGSEEHHGSHRQHRQKEAQEHHSTSHHSSQNGQSQKDHVSVDSHPRHSGTLSHYTVQHRHKEGSVASHHAKDGSSEHHSSHRSGHRKDRYKEFSKQLTSHQHHHGHTRHHPKEILFNDSDGSISSGPRQRHRS